MISRERQKEPFTSMSEPMKPEAMNEVTGGEENIDHVSNSDDVNGLCVGRAA